MNRCLQGCRCGGGDGQGGVRFGKTWNFRTAAEDRAIDPMKGVCCTGDVW